MRNLTCLIFIFKIFITNQLCAQVRISGVVLDKQSQSPIPQADVYLKNTPISTQTNLDGSFLLEIDSAMYEESNKILIINMIGYNEQTHTLKNASFPLTIILKEVQGEENTLKTLVVKGSRPRKKYKNKKENPAYRIMKALWTRKHINGLKNLTDYSYDKYEKIAFDLSNIDSSFTNKKMFKDFDFVFDKIDTSAITGQPYLPLFLTESIYKVQGRNKPNVQQKEEIIARKSSGFNDNPLIAETAKALYRPFDVYDNYLNLFNKSFVSPLSTDAFSVYDFDLLDSTYMDNKRVYHIKYFPRRDADFVFKGDVWISDSSFSVKRIRMHTSKGINMNFIKDVYIEQTFDAFEDSIFLPQKEYIMIDASLVNKKETAKGLYAHRTLVYSNYNTKAKAQPDSFYTKPNKNYEETNITKDDAFWTENRPETLSKNESNVYETLEKLEKIPKFKRWVNLSKTIITGYYNVGKIDLGNIYNTLGYNQVEGLRLRIGGRTFFTNQDHWRAQAYLAYGTKDKRFKYGVSYRGIFYKPLRWTLGAAVKDEVEQFGAALSMAKSNLLDRTFGASSLIYSGINDKLTHSQAQEVFTSIEPIENVEFKVDYLHQYIKSANPKGFIIDYYDASGIKQSGFHNSALGLTITAMPGIQYKIGGIDRVRMRMKYHPTFILRYTKGIKGFLNSAFNYQKLQFYYAQPLRLGSVGLSNISLEMGKIFEAVPLSLLNTVPGNQAYFLAPNAFEQLDFYEFITDTYVYAHWRHHFEGRLLGRIPLLEKLKLRELVFANAAWGSISEKNKRINASNLDYFAPSHKPYYEFGFGIENIGFGNLRPLQVDFIWRGNYLQRPNARRFGVKLGAKFMF